MAGERSLGLAFTNILNPGSRAQEHVCSFYALIWTGKRWHLNPESGFSG